MANFTYALGPWVRRQFGDGYYWVAPDGADGRICLGSLPDCATSPSGVDSRPIGFFCFSPDVTPSLDYLTLGTGDCRELRPWGELAPDEKQRVRDKVANVRKRHDRKPKE